MREETRRPGPPRNRRNVSVRPSCSLLCLGKAIELRLEVVRTCLFLLRYLFHVASLVHGIPVFIDILQAIVFDWSVADDTERRLQRCHIFVSIRRRLNEPVITLFDCGKSRASSSERVRLDPTLGWLLPARCRTVETPNWRVGCFGARPDTSFDESARRKWH